ncbi:TPA: hypothetical protein ACWX1I_003570 [Elizabethkingia anophelis]
MIIKEILSCFENANIISESDNLTLYTCTAIASKEGINKINEDSYQKINSFFTELNYSWDLSVDDIYSIDQNSGYKELELENLFSQNFEIKIQVFKNGDEIYIFNESSFSKYVKSLNLQELLTKLAQKEKYIFRNISFENSSSSNFIGYNDVIIRNRTVKLSSQCFFYNYSTFKYSPEDFSFSPSIKQKDWFLELFQKIYFVMILIYLVDISEIKQNSIIYKIKGSKIFDFELDFENIDMSSFLEYEKIYNWAYSDQNKVEDKIVIIRNIITFYLKSNSLNISPIVYKSILNANELYIKGSVTKYLESRSKIFDQLDGITNKISSSLDTFFSNFQKSIYVFISFYLTIFVLKILNKSDITSALSKEATITGFFLIILSLCYLIFSLITLNLDKNRIVEKYKTLKKRFLDILDYQDISKILNNDEEFNLELKLFRKRRLGYLWLWISTILLLVISLLLTSEWISFKNTSSPLHKQKNERTLKFPIKKGKETKISK